MEPEHDVTCGVALVNKLFSLPLIRELFERDFRPDFHRQPLSIAKLFLNTIIPSSIRASLITLRVIKAKLSCEECNFFVDGNNVGDAGFTWKRETRFSEPERNVKSS